MMSIEIYKKFFRPILFTLDAETAHHLICRLLRFPLLPSLLSVYKTSAPFQATRNLFGLEFPNPVGLAAGFDKNAELLNVMPKIGFGYVEIGTITPKPQAGNPRPRLFRLPEDEALINRLGFNNHGVETVRQRLLNRPPRLIVGGNIGKNRNTPNRKAVEDYRTCFLKLHDVVDYFTVNVSSPNTPNLRALQERGALTELLQELQRLNRSFSQSKPILLKISPDLSFAQIDDILNVVQDSGIDGIIATNTTVSRAGLRTPRERLNRIGAGGLSGKPLFKRSTEIIRYIHRQTDGKLPIIGVGGIHSPQMAQEKFRAGASLIQIYTGLIFEGPGLIGKILNTLQPV